MKTHRCLAGALGFLLLGGGVAAAQVGPGTGGMPGGAGTGPETEEKPEGVAESSAEDAALHSIGRKSMLELIENLSLEQQQVLMLKFLFNFSNGEAGTVLDKSEGAIKSLQHRALASLQKQLPQD